MKRNVYIFSLILVIISSVFSKKLVRKEFISEYDIESVLISGDRILIATEEFYIYHSEDWGDTWESFKVKKTFGGDALHLFKVSNGDLVVSGGLYDDHFIAISKDNGTSWERVWKDEYMEIGCFIEVAPGKIFGFGDEDEYVESSSGLYNWEEFSRPWVHSNHLFYEEDVRCAIRVSEDRFLIAGDDGLLICFNNDMTENFFGKKTINEKLNYTCLENNNNGVLFAGTDEGDILRSTSKGRAWEKISYKSKNGSSIRNISFSPDSLGVAVGEDGLMLISENNGDSWNSYNTETEELLNDVTCLSGNNFIIVGDEGTFFLYNAK